MKLTNYIITPSVSAQASEGVHNLGYLHLVKDSVLNHTIWKKYQTGDTKTQT